MKTIEGIVQASSIKTGGILINDIWHNKDKKSMFSLPHKGDMVKLQFNDKDYVVNCVVIKEYDGETQIDSQQKVFDFPQFPRIQDVNLLEACLKQSITLVEMYTNVNFSSEDVRALAITLFLETKRGGKV